jgi:multidrug transporter EmrE-like cation transporter
MMWIFLVSAGAILAALSQISLKHGLTQVHALLPEATSLLQRIPYWATNLYLWLGLVGLATALVCWVAGLSQVKLNIAYPVFVGLEYSLVMVLSWLILGEAFVSFKLAGIVLVLIGIVIITY